ncbi:MAG: amidohydrolase family protein [Prevotellaceae bacterium]|nr:amidohydrolase family protein [Candidatus Faecinaster equi]
MKKISFMILMLMLAFIMTSCSDDDNVNGNRDNEPVEADIVVYGNIYTAEGNGNSFAQAFAVKDGKFVYVGDSVGATEYIGDKTEIVNYNGKDGKGLVIPGCTEGHGHFIGIEGIARKLSGFRASYENLVKMYIPQKMQTNPGDFLSFGWLTLDVVKYGTNDYATEIEEVSDGHSVVLLDGGGHNALCNRTALRKAGLIDENGHKIKDIRGGDIVTIQGSDNIASGYITDEVVPFVIENAISNVLDDAGYLEACEDAVKELNARGFTSYLDAYINVFDDADTYKYLTKMDTAGTLTVNVLGYYTIRSYDWGLPKGGNIPQRVSDKLDCINALSNQYTKGHIQANGVKLFADGVTDTYTGWISGEYTVDGLAEDKKHGNIIWEQDELNAIVAAANAKGMPVHVHTFGDMACNAVINAYIVSPWTKNLKIRNSLAHVRNISDADIARCAKYNIGIASNMIWHVGDPKEYRDYFLSIMPQKIYESGYPMKSLLEAGINVSSSTDAPCGELIIGSVPNVIGVSVTGLSPDYLDVEPLNPSELLTVGEALKCLTINGASSLGLEKERGSIKVGKYADFVLLDKDVFELEKQDRCKDIFKTNVVATWFEGKKVY